MTNGKRSKRGIVSSWRERRWKKAQRRRGVQERRPQGGNEDRLRAEAAGTSSDRIGYYGGGDA